MGFAWRGISDIETLIQNEGMHNINNMVPLLSLVQAQGAAEFNP